MVASRIELPEYSSIFIYESNQVDAATKSTDTRHDASGLSSCIQIAVFVHAVTAGGITLQGQYHNRFTRTQSLTAMRVWSVS